MVTATKHEGGTAMMRGEMTAFDEHWTFEDEKLGTARVYIRRGTGTEEERRKNRERAEAAVLEMWKSVQRKRAEHIASAGRKVEIAAGAKGPSQ